MRTIRRIGLRLFGVMMAGALTLGAAQAVAQPRSTATAENTCSVTCMQDCQAMGFDGGRCTDPRYTSWWCECYNW